MASFYTCRAAKFIGGYLGELLREWNSCVIYEIYGYYVDLSRLTEFHWSKLHWPFLEIEQCMSWWRWHKWLCTWGCSGEERAQALCHSQGRHGYGQDEGKQLHLVTSATNSTLTTLFGTVAQNPFRCVRFFMHILGGKMWLIVECHLLQCNVLQIILEIKSSNISFNNGVG